MPVCPRIHNLIMERARNPSSVQKILAALGEAPAPRRANPFVHRVELPEGTVIFTAKPQRLVRVTNLVDGGPALPPLNVNGMRLRVDFTGRWSRDRFSWVTVDTMNADARKEAVPPAIVQAAQLLLRDVVVPRRRLSVEAEFVAVGLSRRRIDEEIAQVELEISRRKAKLKQLKSRRGTEVSFFDEQVAALKSELEELAEPEEALAPLPSF
ncbi:hypothetical protein OCUBac02_47460 (plasmid) [Bosea sp. ANAM02]|nr:hypothetical protein OCUBac02_47460 [Bosea sp. ANAM02]